MPTSIVSPIKRDLEGVEEDIKNFPGGRDPVEQKAVIEAKLKTVKDNLDDLEGTNIPDEDAETYQKVIEDYPVQDNLCKNL
jgi:hypothetical protein